MPAQIDKQYIKICPLKLFNRIVSYLFYEGRPLTTKGRWANKWIFQWLALQGKLPMAPKVTKPIFILGTGRSGTTLLGMTLSAHRKIGFLNEPKAIWHYLYPFEDLIGSYTDNKAFYCLDASQATPEMIKKARRIYGHYLRISFASRVVDKYPELIFRYDFVKTIFPDARFIFLSRNGWDTCGSVNKWSERLGFHKNGSIHDWWGRDSRKWHLLCDQVVAKDPILSTKTNKIQLYQDHTHRAAVEWIVTMKKGLTLVENHPDNVFHLRYEDYIAYRQTRQQLLKFCNIIPDKSFNKYADTVLRPSVKWSDFELPKEIKSEFIRISTLLGYETINTSKIE